MIIDRSINFNEFLTNSSNKERWIKSYVQETLKILNHGLIGSIDVIILDVANFSLEIVPKKNNLLEKNKEKLLAKSIYELYPRWDKLLAIPELEKLHIRTKLLEEELLKNRKNINDKIKKNLSDSKEFNIDKSWKELRLIRTGKYEKDLDAILSEPDKAISNGSIIANGPTTTLSKITLKNNKQVIIKRFNSKGVIYSLFRSLIESRAKTCWKGAEFFKWFGIPTAKTLGMLEVKTGPWIKKSYLITEFIEGETLAEFFEEEHDKKDWINVSCLVGEILTAMPKILIAHGDFKSTNFIIKKNEPVLIDLDSFSIFNSKYLFNKSYKKDIARFKRNWNKQPSASKIFNPIIHQVEKMIQ